MNDPHEAETVVATPFRDLATLRREVELLQRVLRLLLIGLVIATLSLCLFMYRQTKLLRFQILAQQAAVIRADKQYEPVRAMLPVFQRLGGRYNDYASNVLSKFNLPALPSPDGPAAPAVKK